MFANSYSYRFPAEILLTAAARPTGEALRLGDRRIHHHRRERVLRHAGREQRVPNPLLRRKRTVMAQAFAG